MRMKTIVTITAGLLLAVRVGNAAHIWEDPGGWWEGHYSYDANAPKYTAQELSLDLFGSYLHNEGKLNDLFKTDIRHGSWGGGAGLNYFITREFGIGTDFNVSSKSEGNLVDHWVGNLFLRLPIGSSGLAPYIFGGGGRAFSPVYDWIYGGGVGLEYRFNPTTGIFGDARFNWSNKSTDLDKLLIRAGLRLVF